VNVKVEEPGKNNVHNNAFYAEEKLLKSELEAMRDCDPLSARHWIVSFYSFIFIPKKRKEKSSEVNYFSYMIFPLSRSTVEIVTGTICIFSNLAAVLCFICSVSYGRCCQVFVLHILYIFYKKIEYTLSVKTSFTPMSKLITKLTYVTRQYHELLLTVNASPLHS